MLDNTNFRRDVWIPARARRDVRVGQGASLPERLDALWEASVAAFAVVVPRLGMDESNVIDLDSRRRLS